MTTDYKSFFNTLTGFDSYGYQRRGAAALLGRANAIEAGLSDEVKCLEMECSEQLPDDGRNILLSAPTGSGKTWAVLVPFIFSRKLGTPVADRILYVLPLRSIADSLYQSTTETLGRSGLLQLCPVRLQTGETSGMPGIGDPTLSEGRIIFCTVDQLLSSYLNIPFSLSPRQANVNAGALVGSLIVLDEFHLLEPSRSLKTSILLTRHLRGLTRFVWMTATQAERARHRLLTDDRLDAVSVAVAPKELSNIPSQRGKKRSWSWSAKSLTADQIWLQHQSLLHERKRTIVVLNTVARAQKIYRDLKAIVPAKIPIYLLHSRFLSDHRKEREATVRKSFARGSDEEVILIATQVIEAGLDISASCLHTDLAPANALVQRAGRCARFEGEEGTVFVYDSCPEDGRRSYQPYVNNDSSEESTLKIGASEENLTMREAIDRTAIELAKISGKFLTFSEETSLIDAVHTGLDLAAVESFNEGESRRLAAEAMTPRSDNSNYGVAHSLIRDVDSVAVLLAEEQLLNDPAARLAPRYEPAIVSVPRTSIAALSKVASDRLTASTWVLKIPKYDEHEWGDAFSGYETVASAGDNFRTWIFATYNSGPLVLNPLLARYTSEIGLELGVPSGPEDWQSFGTLSEEILDAKASPDRKYRAETFQEHIAWVRLHAQLLCGDESVRSKLTHHWQEKGESGEIFELTDHAVGVKHLDRRYGLPVGTVGDLAVLAALLHDTGKLTKAWQQAVWSWQELKARRREHYPPGSDGDRRYAAAQRLLALRRRGHPVLLAHTDYDQKWQWPDGQREVEVERQFLRPNHALEGAWLSLPIVAQHVDHAYLPAEQLAKSILVAISQHHSPKVGTVPINRNQPLTSLALASIVNELPLSVVKGRAAVSLQADQPNHDDWEDFLETNIRLRLKPERIHSGTLDDWSLWPLMIVLVRIVRLADQRGTQIGAT